MRAPEGGGKARWMWLAVSTLLTAAATQAREPYLYPYRPWDARLFGALTLLAGWGLWRTRQVPFLAVLLLAAGWVGVRSRLALAGARGLARRAQVRSTIRSGAAAQPSASATDRGAATGFVAPFA